MTRSIICGVDDSEAARGAARVARNLSSKLGLRLVFVRVVKPGSSHEQISQIAERLEHLSTCTTDVDCGAGWLVDVGHPADRLVAAAAEEEASLIVVGSGGPRTSRLGSVSTEVSRRAKCPVVVVPPGAEAALFEVVAELTAKSKGQTDGVEAPDMRGGLLRFSPDGHRTEARPPRTPTSAEDERTDAFPRPLAGTRHLAKNSSARQPERRFAALKLAGGGRN